MYYLVRALVLRTGFHLLVGCYAFGTNQTLSPRRQPSATPAAGQVDCSQEAPVPQPPDPNAEYGYIHDIIGKDGAFLLTLMRNPGRYTYSAAKLKEAGIIANQFPAADGFCESEEDVTRGCHLKTEDYAKNVAIEDQCKAKQGWGLGCDRMTTAACAESHHRALEIAQHRQHNWTLIMEDDVVPLDPANWQSHFKEIWPKVPSYAKLVRLGWCTFHHNADHGMIEGDLNQMLPLLPRNVPEVLDSAGKMKIVRHIYTDWYPYYYDAGLCTTGYMVHRDAIPDMLGIFPCCCGMDCCFGQGLFNNPKDKEGRPYGVGENIPWGYLNMVSLDIDNSTESTLGWNKHKLMYQFGPLVQDNREVSTARLNQEASEVHRQKKIELQLEEVSSELDALMYMLHSSGMSS